MFFAVKKFAFPSSISSFFDLFRLIRGPNFELFRGISTYFWVFRAISTYFEVKKFSGRPQMNADVESSTRRAMLCAPGRNSDVSYLSSVFQLIPAYSNIFAWIRGGASNVFQPIPAYSSLFPDKKIFPEMNNQTTKKPRTYLTAEIAAIAQSWSLGSLRLIFRGVAGATGLSRAGLDFKLLSTRGLRGGRGDFCRTPSCSVALEKKGVNGGW
jgi:hypothetical protein